MTDITELAQRMKAAAMRAKAATEDYVAHRMSITVCLEECKEFNDLSDGPDNILTLVEALELKEEQRANWFQMAQKLGDDLDKAEKRIAELEEAEQKLCVANVTLDARAELAERRLAEMESRTVKLPPELYTIGELIRTQDNRITDQPMFVVFQKREIIGSDEHSPSRICWVWDGEEVSELRAKRLEALYQDGRDTRGYDRYAMQEVDEFVTACFTEHACKDFLRQNGHNLRQPYIYACGSFRNNEYQLVRNWLAGIKVEAE